jgi:hypothetical protein
MAPRLPLLAALLLFGATRLLPAAAPAPSHADAFTSDGLIKADVAQLKDTRLVAHPNVPIPPDTNVIWCGTLQLAWNEAIKLVGEKLQFENQPPIVDLLNRQDFTGTDLDPAGYVALADFERNHVEAEIRAALQKTFHGAASPELIPPVPPHPGPDDFVAYAYLFKNLAFEQPFMDVAPIDFGRAKLKSFGYFGGYRSLWEKLVRQVTICSYNSPDDFVIKLETKAKGDELILAKVPPLSTRNPTGPSFSGTIDAVLARAAPRQAIPPETDDDLAIPKFNFNLHRDFSELEGLILNPSPAAKIKSKLVLVKAEQLVRFQLNEKGAVLKSEALVAEAGGAPPHIMIFNKPFLILMKRADSPQPYFAMWVGNASLLIPAK